nr:SAV_2336 N-terminal domain-related protein [Methylosinus sp. C49]
MAEALWLAARLGPVEPVAQSPSPKPSTAPSTVVTPVVEAPRAGETPPPPPPAETATSRRADDEKRPRDDFSDLYRPSRRGGEGRRAIGLRVAGLPALPHALEIGRALSPLRRRVASPHRRALDEEETVRRIVEENVWLPVFAPMRERSGDVALVIDAGDSLRLWEPTIGELRRLLERHGAFRDVRGWRLHFDGDHGPRLLADSRALTRQAPRSLGELQDPAGRRIVLVASDCVGPWWRDGRMHEALRAWAGRGPLALVQLLPQRMWPRTPLGLADLRLRAEAPGLPNTRLRGTTADGDASPPLPVMTLDPEPIARWAAVTAGRGGVTVSGVRLSRFLPPPPAEAWGAEDDAGAPPPLGPRERVRRFAASASAPARQLAAYLAGAPLSLPVMRLVQHLMMPSSRHAHLAEVLLGGLIRPMTEETQADPDDVEYDFHDPLIRDLLREGQTAAEAMAVTARVLDAVSAFVAGEAGRPRSFAAALADDSGSGPLALPIGGRPFARLGAEALRRYGGAYAALADRLAGGWEQSDEIELTLERRIERKGGRLRDLAWSPNGELFAMADQEGRVEIRAVSGSIERSLVGERVAWRPDGAALAVGGAAPRLVVHRLPSWEPIEIPLDEPVSALGWAADGRSLAVGGSDATLVNLAPDEPGPRVSSFLPGTIRQLAWSGDWIALAMTDAPGVVVMDGREPHVVVRLPSSGAPPHSVAWTNDGELLISGDAEGRIAVWRIDRMVSSARPVPDTPKSPLRLLDGHSGPIRALSIDHSRQILASRADDGLRLWRMDQGRRLAFIPVATQASEDAVDIAFHPRRPLLLAPDESGRALRLLTARLRPRPRRFSGDRPHILMLMWEIPPLVVGGVWTACHALVRKLRRDGARVTVVAPWERARLIFDPFGDGTPVVALGIAPPEEGKRAPSPYDQTPASWSTASVGAIWSSYLDDAAPPPREEPSHRIWSSYGGAPRAWSIYGGYSSAPAWSSYGGRPSPYSVYDEQALSASPLFRLIEEFQRRLRDYVATADADLIHAHDWVTFDAARAASTLVGVPWVAHFHSLEIDRRPDGGDYLIERIEQGAVNAATRLVAPSDVTRRALIDRYYALDDRIAVIPNTAPEAAGSSVQRGDPTSRRVVFIGRLARQKGLDRFCDLADRVSRAGVTARFEVFGDGEERARLRDRTVVWRGPLGWNERGHAYGGASVVVVPSRAEPFGMVILEAMERGVPVVYAKESGAAEALRAGLRIAPDDIGAMANMVIALLEDGGFWRKIVEEQSQALQDYRARADERRLVDLWRMSIAEAAAEPRELDDGLA